MSTPTGTVTFLFTDVEGSTRLWEKSPEAMRFALARHDDILRQAIESKAGYIFATGGDAFSSAFQAASDALEAALAAQVALQGEPWPEIDLRVRMALHVGEAEERGGDYFGPTLNRTARVLSTAAGSEILVSSAIASVAVDSLPDQAALVDVGERKLKDLERTEHVYRLTAPGLADLDGTESGDRATVGTDDRRHSLVVLPFDVIAGDKDTEVLADGLVEDIISAISAWRNMSVMSRHSGLAYRGKLVDIREVAEDLGVRYVLEGSLRQSGDKIRVAAQLIDATDGSHIWAEQYDSAVEDGFDFQDRTTRRIASAVEPAIFHSEARQLSTKPEANFDAWDHITQGRKLIETVHQDEVEAGMGHMHVAIDLHPGLADAYSYLGLAHFFRAWAHWVDDEEAEYQKAIEWCKRSIGVDHQQWSAHNTMAVTYLFSGQVHRGRTEAQIALSLNPNAVLAHFVIGDADLFSGDVESALDSFRTCLQLDPHGTFSHFYHGISGACHYLLGEYDLAIGHARDAVARKGGYLFARVVLAASLARSGAAEQAEIEVADIRDRSPHFDTSYINQPFQPEHRADLLEGLRLAGLEDA